MVPPKADNADSSQPSAADAHAWGSKGGDDANEG